METQIANGIHVRWMIRIDLPMVLAIETECFDHPWREEDFIRCVRTRNCIGMVAIDVTADHGRGLVVGFMIYELHKNRLHLLNLAVNKRFRNQGVATAMIDKLKSKLTPERRNRIMLEIREANLPGQLFFRNRGVRAISVLREFWDDNNEDAYLMQYRVDGPAQRSHNDGMFLHG